MTTYGAAEIDVLALEMAQDMAKAGQTGLGFPIEHGGGGE